MGLIGRGCGFSKLAVIIGTVRPGDRPGPFDAALLLAEGDTILVLGDPANLQTLESEAGARWASAAPRSAMAKAEQLG